MYENKEQSRKLVVVCGLSTVMDDVEKQLLILITCTTRRACFELQSARVILISRGGEGRVHYVSVVQNVVHIYKHKEWRDRDTREPLSNRIMRAKE